jgi:sugar O-acyltransferase (sialic acid O-acetyltransferase NeuD family)
MILYGASGHAKVVIDILEKSGVTIDFLFDDNPEITELCGYRCSLYEQSETADRQIIITIGNNRIRKKIRERIEEVKFGIAVDIRASVSGRAHIGKGSVVMPGATVNSGSVIGEHAIINTNASVDHDCLIGDYVHVSPGCSVAGNVVIGEGTHAGTGASVIPGIKIGKWCVIGAGAVIINDIPDYSVVVGNPGRIIKSKTNIQK